MSLTPAPPGATGTVHVGRQAVYDRAREIVGYELLFRRDAAAVTATERGSDATSQVIITSITEIGLGALVGDRRCFLNLTRDFLVGDLPLPFGPDQMVLEVLEALHIDDELVRGVERLVDKGYVIALDDFVCGQGYERLLGLASLVKIDVLEADTADVLAAVTACRRFPHLRLVAERLETDEHVRFAMDAGFDYFQGYALGRPEVVSVAALAPPRLRGIELLGLLVDNNLPASQLTSLIISDAALSVRMLAAANADALGLPVQISSVQEAILLLGGARLRDWTALMLASDSLAGAAPKQHSGAAIGRARRCQKLAERLGVPAESAFAVGLISAVAETLDEPAAVLAPRLSLSDELTEALVHGTGPLGELLSLVTAYEATDPPAA
ncbi:MAG TPA: HDOD domain-containing protein [Pilimelia sp.]|nr:HDOD domain-containing protein [Pilimelia sp.]